jgi:hypothetical protein
MVLRCSNSHARPHACKHGYFRRDDEIGRVVARRSSVGGERRL